MEQTLSLVASIASIVGSIFTIFLAFQVVSIKKIVQNNSENKVTQANNEVTGDMVGRDKRK